MLFDNSFSFYFVQGLKTKFKSRCFFFQIRLEYKFLVPMQCMGNSDCFPRWKRAATVRRYPVCFCPVSSTCFRVSVIHRPLAWTTGSLTCLRDHCYAYLYTRGLGTPTTSQHNILTRKNSQFFSCAPDGVRTSGLWISNRCSSNWATPSSVRKCILVLSQNSLMPACRYKRQTHKEVDYSVHMFVFRTVGIFVSFFDLSIVSVVN